MPFAQANKLHHHLFSSLFLTPHIYSTSKSYWLYFKIYPVSLISSLLSFLSSYHPGLNHRHFLSVLSTTLLTDPLTSVLAASSFIYLFILKNLLIHLFTYSLFQLNSKNALLQKVRTYYSFQSFPISLRIKNTQNYLEGPNSQTSCYFSDFNLPSFSLLLILL